MRSEAFDERIVPSGDLYRFRGDREGKEGVGREVDEVFLRSCGDSERMVRDFKRPLFRLCLRARLVGGSSAGKTTGWEDDWIMELRNGKMVRGSAV